MAAKFKFPAKMGACADRLFELRAARLEQQKVVEAMQAEETALKEHIIATLPKSEASGVAGRLARVSIVVKLVPTVKDWPSLYEFVKRTGAFELLQRRVTESAVKERWESGETVPGVEAFEAVTVSISKV